MAMRMMLRMSLLVSISILSCGGCSKSDVKDNSIKTVVAQHFAAIYRADKEAFLSTCHAEDSRIAGLFYDYYAANRLMQEKLEDRYGIAAVQRFNTFRPRGCSLVLTKYEKEFDFDSKAVQLTDLSTDEVAVLLVEWNWDVLVTKRHRKWRVDVDHNVTDIDFLAELLTRNREKIEHGLSLLQQHDTISLEDLARQTCGAGT